MELKLRIQQAPQFNIQQQQIHYAGPNPQSLTVSVGPLPAVRQWPGYSSYIDVTNDVSDLYKLKLTWTNDRDTDGISTPGAFQPKKAVSGTLTFENTAYQLIKKWLIEDVSAPLNSVWVKIEHVGCGSYEGYSFNATDLRWCENDVCIFEISLKQADEQLNCIQRTLINDNHLEWFPESYPTTPANGKRHPRFSYCNEIRPNGIMILLWSLGGSLWFVIGIIKLIVWIVTTIVKAIIKAIVTVINLVISFINALGANITPLPDPQFDDPKDILEDFAEKFIESGGCGREHPAPLIRDYIYNVCKKCGLETDTLNVTVPLFFADNINIETSERGVINTANPHTKDCYFNAPIKRGIRRFTDMNFFSAGSPNTKDYWIPENAPLLTLDMFLDQLKAVYNAEWRVVKNRLYFQRKDFFVDGGGAILDFTTTSADRNLLLEGICYEWNETKYPAVCQGLYSNDATDVCGNEAMQPMNGPMVVFGKTDLNPNFEGILDKSVQFGATKFRLDGASTDYICDALQVLVNSMVLSPAFTILKTVVTPEFKKYADYALLLKDETAQMPKILTWDGQSYENAKVVRPYSGYPIDPANGPAMPGINSLYNNYPSPTPWHVRHEAQTHVLGSAFSLGPNPPGYYKVQGLFGGVITEQPALLCNYPMYYEPGYYDTLWDWFHWIDDPKHNPKLNINFTAKMELCCDTLKKLQVFGEASGIVLGHKVKIPGKYYSEGRIKEIELSYDTQNEIGQYIQLKGVM